MQTTSKGSSRLFTYLATATLISTFALIVFGAIVRVTDSGLGCGNEWPTCHGSIIPPWGNITAWIEWLHRLFAVLIGLLGLVTLAVAVRTYRKRQHVVLTLTVIAAVLYALQAALGRWVVILDLPPTAVTLHLGTAMLLLGALLGAALLAAYRPKLHYARDNFTALAYVTATLSLIIILTGALVRGAGATLACFDWPLCNGSLLPFDQGPLQIIHWLHRAAVLGLGIALTLLVWQAWRSRPVGAVRTLAAAAAVLFLTQAGIGALFVFSAADEVWGAAHVAFAALTWASLVALAIVDTVNTTEIKTRAEWQLQSSAAGD